jgi:hypothetical protein
MKNKAFEACLEMIEREGWKNFSFAKASQDSAIPLYVFHDQFSSPSEVMVHLFKILDQEVLKSLVSYEGLSPKDTLFDILMSRFEAAQPYKPVLRSFWRDWIIAPTEAPAFACQGFSSMAWILEAAGLESRGLKGILRIQGLTALYLLTLRTWLTDDSPDLGKTMVFLDKGLVRLERAARFLNGF